jgi:uncharacterized membrane protein
MQRRSPACPSRRSAQRGMLTATLGLLMIPLMGFVALVVDIGRLYVNKTELQNAADSCALAAAAQLSVPTLPANAFIRANTAGLALARTHMVDFGHTQLQARDILVEFNENQSGGSWKTSNAFPPPGNNARYARCTIQRQNIETWFLQLLQKPLFSISAQAIANIQSSTSNNCGLPTGATGYCSKTSSLYQ